MRKTFFAAISGAALLLAGCSTAQITADAATIEADIQAGSAALCGIVPTIGTILAIAGAVTGTSDVITIANTGISAIEADVCSAAPAAASARLRALPLRSGVPAVIGTSKHGVTVSGWRS